MNDYRIDLIDWREGVLTLHKPDGTRENTIMLALSGLLHQQATAMVAAARRASNVSCKDHHAAASYAMLSSGPDAGTVVDINTSGDIQRVDLCQCGARRVTYITSSHRKQGGKWI